MTALAKIRQIINPPYSRKDFLAILGILFILVAIPFTTLLSLQRPSVAPQAATATITLDSVSSAGYTKTSVLKWSHTVGGGSNRILLVGISVRGSPRIPVTSVTYDGVPLTPTGVYGSGYSMELWRLINPDSGTHDVVVNIQSSERVAAGATSWTGVDQSNPNGSFASASGSGGKVTLNVPSTSGEVVVDLVAMATGNESPTGSPASGQTELWKRSDGSTISGGSSKPGAASVAMTWSFSTTTWRPMLGAVSLKPASIPLPSCTNECSTAGARQCVSSTSYKTCGNYDADSCLEWSSASKSCPAGQTCSGSGACSAHPPTKPPVTGGGTLDSLQLEISVPYLSGSLKAKADVGGVSKDIEITPANKSYTLDLKGSNLSLNKEYNLVVTSGKTLVRKTKFTPTASSTNLKVADLILGDLSQDNSIDSTDQVSLVDSIASQTSTGDLNADTSSNSMDWAILLTSFGKKGD